MWFQSPDQTKCIAAQGHDLSTVGHMRRSAGSHTSERAGTEAPAKKAKITLTEEQEKFAKQFHPAASKIDKTRKIPSRHVSGRGPSTKKQGSRQHDVKPETLKKRVLQFPDQFLQAEGGQMHCVACCTNVGSSKSDVTQHLKTMQHTRKVQHTTLNYRYSHSLTNEDCSSTVSR